MVRHAAERSVPHALHGAQRTYIKRTLHAAAGAQADDGTAKK